MSLLKPLLMKKRTSSIFRLHEVLEDTPRSDRRLVMANFNAKFDRDRQLMYSAVGPHGSADA